MPVELKLTPGQVADITQAEALLENHNFDAAIADKVMTARNWSIASRAGTRNQ